MVANDVIQVTNLQNTLQSINPVDVDRYVSNMEDFEFGYQDDNVIIYYKKNSEYEQITIPKNQKCSDYAMSLSDTIKDISTLSKMFNETDC